MEGVTRYLAAGSLQKRFFAALFAVIAALCIALSLGATSQAYAVSYVDENADEVSADSSVVTTALTYNNYPVYRGSASIWPMNTTWVNDSVYYYSDGFFTESSSNYNIHLASLSACLQGAANWDFYFYHTTEKMLTAIGATDIDKQYFEIPDVYDRYAANSDPNKADVMFAIKTLSSGEKMVCVIFRGGTYEGEWPSMFTPGTGTGDSKGITPAVQYSLNALTSYLSDKGLSLDDENLKFWITGYSRGGTLANILAKEVTDLTSKAQVYAYTIEALAQGGVSDNAASYTNIHNVVGWSDFTCQILPYVWGFGRYGVDHFTGITLNNPDIYEQEARVIQQIALYSDNTNPVADANDPNSYYYEGSLWYRSVTSFAWKQGYFTSILQSFAGTDAFSDVDDTSVLASTDVSGYIQEIAKVLARAGMTRDMYAAGVPDAVAEACSENYLNVDTMSMQDAISETVTAFSENDNNLNIAVAAFSTMASDGNNTSLMARFMTYIQAMQCTPGDSFAQIMKDFWTVYEPTLVGVYQYYGVPASVYADEIAGIKQRVTPLVYFLCMYTASDNNVTSLSPLEVNNIGLTEATCAYNYDMFRRQHFIGSAFGWLRTMDSFYSQECMIVAAAGATETNIATLEGSDLSGTIVTVKDSDGGVVATIVDGDLAHEGTSWSSDSIYLSSTGAEMSIFTPAGEDYTILVKAPLAKATKKAAIAISRRTMNELGDGVVIDLNGQPQTQAIVFINGKQTVSCAVGAEQTVVSRLGDVVATELVEGVEYRIVSAADDSLLLDAAGISPVKGSNVSVWTNNFGDNQKFVLTKVEGDRYIMSNAQNTNVVLDAAGVNPKAGSNVSVWTSNGDAALNQQWIFEAVEGVDGGFIIHSAADENLVLTVSSADPSKGANVVVESALDMGSCWVAKDNDPLAAQVWRFSPSQDITYAAVSATGMMKNIIDGTYVAPSVKVSVNGNVLALGSDYKLLYNGSETAPTTAGEYTVVAEGIGAYDGTVSVGTLKLYDLPVDLGIEYVCASAAGEAFVLDVASVNPQSGANISVWSDNAGDNQLFVAEKTDEGYIVLRSAANTDLVLDAAGVTPKVGANVSTWSFNGGLNQQWIIAPGANGGYVFICAANPNLVLDAAGVTPVIGANVSVWTANGGLNQSWFFKVRNSSPE